MFSIAIGIASISGYPCWFADSLIVPFTGNHAQIGTSLSVKIHDLVVAAVEISKCLVEGNIKRCKLIVVADYALEECLIAEVEVGQIVV